jgi:hypothetical protein
MALGFLIFSSLSLFAALAAISVAARLRYESRGELALTAMVLWHAVVLMPLTWLGWTNHLTRFAAGMLVCSTALATLTLSFVRTDPKDHAQEVKRAIVSLLRLPFDGIRLAYREDGFFAFSAIFALGTMLWTAWISYLAPSSSWDGIWYHECIVGWAIQNHGFQHVQIPFTLENVNGCPRLCETLNLWFVLFTDRRFIEMPNSVVAAPMLMLGFYATARRFAPSRGNAIAWAAALYLIPGSLLQMRSTYVDVQVAAFFLAALHYATRPNLRLADAWIAALTLGMLGASKSLGLPWMGVLGIVALPRVMFANVRRRPLLTLGTVVGGLAAAAVIAAPIYVRNWTTNHNPLWPVQVNLERFDIHWPGNFEPVIEKPYTQLLTDMLQVYVPGHDFHDPRVWGYGMGFPFFVLPWAMLMVPVALFAVFYSLFHRPFDRPTWNLLLVALAIGLTWPIAPVKWFARYNIHIVAGLAFVAAWSGTRSWTRKASNALAAIAIGTSMIMLYWADPGWSVSIDAAMQLAKMTPEQRATWESIAYSFESKAVAAREAEIGSGDVVAFTDDHTFPSLLWNEKFSNTVIWVQSGRGESFLARVDSTGAKWIAATPGTPDYQTLNSSPDRWQQVGLMSQSPQWIVFRRVN